MSEKPNTVAIGAFVIGALLIGITTIIFALGTGFGRESSKVVMVFEGSVKGLNVGAPVALRGVQIGQVTDVELVLNSDTIELIMLVEAEISGDNIRQGGRTDRGTDLPWHARTAQYTKPAHRAALRAAGLSSGQHA